MNKKITKLEKKISYVQGLIDAQKLKLDKYQATLLALIQQINEIKSKQNNIKKYQINMNNKINKNGLKGLNIK